MPLELPEDRRSLHDGRFQRRRTGPERMSVAQCKAGLETIQQLCAALEERVAAGEVLFGPEARLLRTARKIAAKYGRRA